MTPDQRSAITERLEEIKANHDTEGLTVREYKRPAMRRAATAAIGVHPDELDSDDLAEVERMVTGILYS
jgi:hypothetical protein